MQNQGNKGNSTTVDWRPEPEVVARYKNISAAHRE